MKTIAWCLGSCLWGMAACAQAPAGLEQQTLFSYGANKVTVGRFLQSYLHNPGEGLKASALEAYLPLFINYNLKVQAAYDMRLDTLPTHLAEMGQYKGQLAESYLAERAGINQLTAQAAERLKLDIQLGHIEISATGADTAGLGQKAWQAYRELQQGKSWQQAALQYSSLPGVANSRGVAGWITAFTLPYAYENAVYALKAGGFTEPIAFSGGYHLLGRLAQRPGQGWVQVAQLLLATPEGTDSRGIEAQQKMADSLYRMLQSGQATLAMLAPLYSQDRTSSQLQGQLPPFTAGTYDAAFEQQAFALQQPGDLSKPFLTSHGWHILQLIKKIPPTAALTDSVQPMLRQKINEDGRLATARQQYLQQLATQLPVRWGTLGGKVLQAFTDSLLQTGTMPGGSSRVLFYLGRQAVTLSDWAAYARVYAGSGQLRPGQQVEPRYRLFVQNKKESYLLENLELADTGFAQQYRQFKEANLLFEAMERKVWGRAAQDSAGLAAFFAGRQKQYIWGPHALCVVFNCADSTVVAQIRQAMQQNAAGWRSHIAPFDGLVYADSARYSYDNLPVSGVAGLAPGSLSPVASQAAGMYSFVYLVAHGQAGRPQTFEEARGAAMAAWQEQLEQNWLTALRKKYPVVVQQKVWQALLKKYP
ncbi:MAG: peptidylprolyl isomerase [Chitinophagaceae bacterium]|nr:peptidylprolyl isomerase [Chitinophagaceae bacterium]